MVHVIAILIVIIRVLVVVVAAAAVVVAVVNFRVVVAYMFVGSSVSVAAALQAQTSDPYAQTNICTL